MKRAIYAGLLLLVLCGAFLAGAWSTRRAETTTSTVAARKILYYVDPMHPAYKSDKPGIAPDCGMELVPVYEDGSFGGAGVSASAGPSGVVSISLEKQQLIGVRVGRVERAGMTPTIRTIGRVVVDENRVHRLVSPTEGWLRELYGGTTGSLVKKDQVLSTFYSRDMIGAQQALFFALSTLDRYKSGDGSESQVTAANQQIRAAETNLMTIGMSDAQMEELKRTRKPAREIEVRAPATGFVLARNVFPNLRYDRNTELYRIADISQVWIVADLFDNEGRFFRPGLTARVTLSSLPGKVFHARVNDILPQVDPTVRTLKVRLETDNPDYTLRPDMFVDVELPITLPPAITVPADALVDSGVKKIVYVAKGNGVFEPRTVETGWRAGDQIEIVKGLMVGEKIVVAGIFLLDSESRMRAAAAGLQGETSECPVCGMEVDIAKATAAGLTSTVRGQTYYFCAADDKAKFDKDPSRYLRKAAKGPMTEAGKRLEQVEWKEPPSAAPAPGDHGHAVATSPAGHQHPMASPAAGAPSAGTPHD